ncbi:MAG TPA: OsmC family protein [Solirubrobacteraceae bacterium]|jgi:putative redox protein
MQHKATARRTSGFSHTLVLGEHQVTIDEPRDVGGDDEGPCPEQLLAASLASCTAITIEMYGQRKGWDIGPVEVDAQFTPAERGCPTRFELVLRLPSHLSEEQVASLRVIAAKCPIHRTLDGEVMFSERVERVNLAP